MSLDLAIFILFYFLAIFSTIGYGLVIERVLKIEGFNLNIGYTGLLGILFLITYSYFSNFLLPHGLYHNSILNLLGIFFFFIILLTKKMNYYF